MNTQQIAAQGRYGDNTLVHASADEVKGLDALSRSIYGQNLPRNPQTGLPEAFLFAPFLAPLLAGGLGMTGAIGTGLLAGGLGAAEAAARGMDDPLQQGLLAGITGGAAAGIGNALSAAGGATQAATAATPSAAATGAGGLTSTADITSGAYKAAQAGAPTAFAPNPAMMAAEAAAPKTGLAGIGQQFSQMGRGAKALMQPGAFKEGGVGQTFMQQAKVPAIAGGVGLMGQSALAEEQRMSDLAEEREREREEAYNRSAAMMQSRVLPMYNVGSPFYAEGGIVNLANGGALPAGVVGYDEYGNPVYAANPALNDPNLMTLYGNDDGGLSLLTRVRERIFGDTATSTASTGAPDPGKPNPAGMVGRSPEYKSFLRNLQQGMGNIKASQASGYTGGRYASEIPPTPAGNMRAKYDWADLSPAQQARFPVLGAAAALGARGAPTEDRDMAAGGYLDGGAVPGDGMSDSQPAMIDGQQPAALSSGEFVVPADVVSGLGNGSSDAGAQQLYAMMDRIRKARTGTTEQAPKVNPNRMMVA